MDASTYMTTIVLWIFAAFIFLSDKKNKANICLSAAGIFAGFPGVSTFLIICVTPFIHNTFPDNTALSYNISVITGIVVLGSYLFYPYSILLFGIYYSEFFEVRRILLKRILIIVFFIPVIIVFSITPLTFCYNTKCIPNSINIIMPWALGCFLLANFLLVFSYFKSKTNIEKKQRLLVCIMVTPTTLASFYTAFYLIIGTAKIYSNIISTCVLLMFIIFAARYGILGLRLRIELKQLDNRIKTSFFSTSALNHSIKNELQNISACNQIIKLTNQEVNNPKLSAEFDSKIKIIQDSVNRILSITSKMNEQTKEIVLDESQCSLYESVTFAIKSTNSLIQNKDIRIINNTDLNISVLFDPTHLQEVLINIIRNAIDAIYQKGEIHIEIFRFRKHVSLVIRDNGMGISKEELKYVFEPFFSTKRDKLSFGLGLTYCYNVMRKHGGSLEVKSEIDKGTSVVLNFSPKKILHISSCLSENKSLLGDIN